MAKKIIEPKTTVKIQFTFAPIGAYGLSYFIGDIAEIDADLAKVIVANGHGIIVEQCT